jgi:hypothetical protein
MPAPVEGDVTDLVSQELRARGGVLQSLMRLADTICDAADQVATGVRDVAWVLDRERRGAISAPARVDGVELAHTIIDLLRGDLLDDEDRAEMVEQVREALPPATKRKATKARRARR